jgi:cytochrome c-type biogenesis protein CcmH
VRTLVAAALLAFATAAFGQASEVAHPDANTEGRLKALAEELRCLVCQNQTIADSHAPLAVDLRNQIRAQVTQGRSDDQIRAYMVERYGDFVLYKPPFKASTAILWLAPALLLAIGAVVFWTVVARRRPNAPAPEPAPRRRAEIEALLEERAEAKPKPATGSPSGKR